MLAISHCSPESIGFILTPQSPPITKYASAWPESEMGTYNAGHGEPLLSLVQPVT